MTWFELAERVPEVKRYLMRIMAVPDYLKDALNAYIEKYCPLKEEEERKLKESEELLKNRVHDFPDSNRKVRILTLAIADKETQKTIFGKELRSEEIEHLKVLHEFISGEHEALKRDIAEYYSILKALKEFGWDLHYGKKTLCIVCGTPKTELGICPKCKIMTRVFTR